MCRWCNAPIRRKKSRQTFYGDAQILFFCFFRGVLAQPQPTVYLRDFTELALGNLGLSSQSSESVFEPLLVCFGRVRLGSPGEAESGSAGVQPWRGISRPTVRRWCISLAGLSLPGIFLSHHRTPELCLEKPTVAATGNVSFSRILVLAAAHARSTSGNGQSVKSPKHLSGALPCGGP